MCSPMMGTELKECAMFGTWFLEGKGNEMKNEMKSLVLVHVISNQTKIVISINI